MLKITDVVEREHIWTLLDDPRSKLLWYGPGLFSIEIQRWLLPDNKIIEIEIHRCNEPIIIWKIK